VILVVDANMIFAESGLSGPLWTGVKQAVKDDVLRVVVPKIVAAEVQARNRTQREKFLPERPPRAAGEAALTAYEALTTSVTAWVESYDATKVLTDAGFEVVDTPDVPHDLVAQRAIDRVPPFNANGGGYRDAMHWFSLLAIAKANPSEDIVLLSSDAGYAKEGQLHPALIHEARLELRGRDVVLCRALDRFDVPGKYAGEEIPARVELEEARRVVDTLFQDGPVQATDLWISAGLLYAEDADLSSPSGLDVQESRERPLVDGGMERLLRIRARVHVAFDWSDSPNEPSLVELEVRYTLDPEGQVTTADLVASRIVLDVDDSVTEIVRRSLNDTLSEEAVERIRRSISASFPQELLDSIARTPGPTLPSELVARINHLILAPVLPQGLIESISRAVTLNISRETLAGIQRAAEAASIRQIEREVQDEGADKTEDLDGSSGVVNTGNDPGEGLNDQDAP
jgi:hypothetical protein